ncbi:NGG1p interacting factor NIF3 [Patescibacteria group bacterium]|nr:NGG1p interacting factor NIF3 [Patescibacteria group bacterium]MBU1895943.1 NGG1p interacting factor NIF3 [Patescibacteria group bacterium]
MTVQQIFDLAIKMGIKADPRGGNGIEEYLENIKKEYEGSRPEEKKYFDKEKLTNPYADSRIHTGKGDSKVSRVMAGIDIEGTELLLASQLEERGKKIDLVMGHHPIGKGLADLHAVMDMQVEIFEKAGVPIHVAEKLMEDRISEVGRGVHPINHYRIIDLADLLKVNLMNTHTITDNLVHNFLKKHIEKKKPRLISDMIETLLDIPEYQEAMRRGAGPKIFIGNKKHRVGKYVLEMTGGTSTSDKLYKELSRYGISTVVGMHMKDTARTKAGEHHMNVVVAGHMASDSLGMNLFLDELEKKGVEIVPCGGLIRVSRVSNKQGK